MYVYDYKTIPEMVCMQEDIRMLSRRRQYHAYRRQQTDTSNPLGAKLNYKDRFVVKLIYDE